VHGSWLRSRLAHVRLYAGLVGVAIALSAAAIGVAVAYDLPLRDPDGLAGPTYVRLPAILGACFLLDVLPRVWRRRRGAPSLTTSFWIVAKERWPAHRIQLVLIGLGSWYLAYVAFRNLKGFVPFVRDGTADASLLRLDREIAMGDDPADILHQVLGTEAAAHFLSFVYVAWIVFIPLSLAAALVWTRDARRGIWYVTAVSFDWMLGAATYYLVPSVGPIYERPGSFAELPDTASSRLAGVLLDARLEVLADPHSSEQVQTIAAFASLHVGILVTAALVAHLSGLALAVRWGLWLFLGLTVLATVYLGWHYLLDAIAGAVLGALGVWLAARTNGIPLHRHVPASPPAGPYGRSQTPGSTA